MKEYKYIKPNPMATDIWPRLLNAWGFQEIPSKSVLNETQIAASHIKKIITSHDTSMSLGVCGIQVGTSNIISNVQNTTVNCSIWIGWKVGSGCENKEKMTAYASVFRD